MLNLFPNDDRARRLSQQTFLLSEFLEKMARNFSPPKLARKAIVHGHCHHKSIMRMTDEESILRKMGIDFETPAPGCCGMAGAFGFEADKYDVSVAIGELELLPAVRKASPESLVIADGFSCREQVAQCTNRRALHLAEVIQLAAQHVSAAESQYPERHQFEKQQADLRKSMKRAGMGVVAIAAGLGLLWALRRQT